jgi:hypothetical protein
VTAKAKGRTTIFTVTAPKTGSFWIFSRFYRYFGLFFSNPLTSDERMGETSRTTPQPWAD